MVTLNTFKKSLPALAFAALVAISPLLPTSPARAEQQVFPTERHLELGLRPVTYQAALDQAKSEGKFVLLYFWATWCGNCREFSEQVLTDPQILKALDKDFKFVSIDVDEDRAMSQSYKVRVVPTMIFLDQEGDPASVMPGAVPGEIFTLVLAYMSRGAYARMEFSDFVDEALGELTAAESPIWVGALARRAFDKARDPKAAPLAAGFLHLSLRGLTSFGNWTAATAAGKMLTSPRAPDGTAEPASDPLGRFSGFFDSYLN
jgi:thiol-disulfide isomerase/thioredoxin